MNERITVLAEGWMPRHLFDDLIQVGSVPIVDPRTMAGGTTQDSKHWRAARAPSRNTSGVARVLLKRAEGCGIVIRN